MKTSCFQVNRFLSLKLQLLILNIKLKHPVDETATLFNKYPKDPKTFWKKSYAVVLFGQLLLLLAVESLEFRSHVLKYFLLRSKNRQL